jgi:ribosome-binding factor A
LGRLCAQIQEEVSEIICRKLKDPRVGFVTLTGVKVSPDLGYADIHVSVMGEPGAADRTMACLDGARSFIRAELGRRLAIRRIPEIRFHRDDSGIRGARIDSLLKNLRDPQRAREGAPAGEGLGCSEGPEGSQGPPGSESSGGDHDGTL